LRPTDDQDAKSLKTRPELLFDIKLNGSPVRTVLKFGITREAMRAVGLLDTEQDPLFEDMRMSNDAVACIQALHV
jgi:hypothetical protein